ncbi:MAG: hypothetical protein FWE98_06820 [Oscillospiraceae bacterium]|nr:hypothetical protein [Oscillospiraceae bacterium]
MSSLISAVILQCYFADYLDQINIWLVEQGDDPIDFGEFMQTNSSMITQMSEMLSEQIDSIGIKSTTLTTLSGSGTQTQLVPNFLTGSFAQLWASISNFFSNLFQANTIE